MSSKFWDRTAQSYDDGIQKHEGDYDEVIAKTLTYLAPDDIVFEVGCASGEQALDIAPHVQSVYGIDISEQMIHIANDKAQQRHVDNVQFQQLDIFDASLTVGQFNAVIAFNVLHLVTDISKTLDRIHDLLADGGIIISQTTCLGEHTRFVRWSMSIAQMVKLVPKVHAFTIEQLEKQFTDANFDITESQLWDENDHVHWIVARKR